MDFTLKTYHSLLCALQKADYRFYTFEEYCERKEDLSDSKFVILRHDVDEIASNALKIALLEHELGIRATYYFRIVKQSFDPGIIRKIVALGHEVGYHYEDLAITHGIYKNAWEHFQLSLAKIREFYPVKTICMHGSPLSRWDNRKLWEKYEYRQEGIIGEPYFDVDYSSVLYITDTGRAWNNTRASIRDRVKGGLRITINSTHHLIELIKNGQLSDKLIINTHPQRWFVFGIGWMKELVFQRIKNVAKNMLYLFISKKA